MLDLIIIGAGSAGISAYKEARKYTHNLRIINDGAWDTTCARVGCMPSKILVSTANRLHDAHHADRVGLNLQIEADTSRVMTHVQALRDRFTRSVIRDVDSWNPEHKISGKAKFINANTIEVNGEQLQAKAFILAVGSTPRFDQDDQKALGDRLISTDDIFELPDLPKRLAVIGSGAIAIELSQAMHNLGVEVTTFARSRHVGILSSDNLQNIAQAHISQQLSILFETLPSSMSRDGDEVVIDYQDQQGQAQTIRVDYVLSAIGRNSLLSTLDLYKVDASFTDVKKLPIHDDTKQLGDYPMFVVGDAFSKNPIQHIASYTGKHVVSNALNYPQVEALPKLSPLAIVFSNPQMAIAGQSKKELEQRNIVFITGFQSFENQGRARTLGKNYGGIEVYIEKSSQRLLGAELFMDSAEHLAHMLSWMIAEQVTLEDILDRPYYHPTLEEGLRSALKHARRQLRELG